MNNEKESAGGETTTEDKHLKCSTTDNETYTCEGSTLTWEKTTISDDETENSTLTKDDVTGGILCTYEYDSKNDKYVENCENVESKVSAGDLFVTDPLELSQDEAQSADNCKYSIDKESCENHGDYYILAKRKCEEQGGRLPTLAELKVLRNKQDGTISGGNYRASETRGDQALLSWILNRKSSIVPSYNYNDSFFGRVDAVCVGN